MDVRPGGSWRYISSAPGSRGRGVLRGVPRGRPAERLQLDVHVRRRGRRPDGRPGDPRPSRTSAGRTKVTSRRATWARPRRSRAPWRPAWSRARSRPGTASRPCSPKAEPAETRRRGVDDREVVVSRHGPGATRLFSTTIAGDDDTLLGHRLRALRGADLRLLRDAHRLGDRARRCLPSGAPRPRRGRGRRGRSWSATRGTRRRPRPGRTSATATCWRPACAASRRSSASRRRRRSSNAFGGSVADWPAFPDSRGRAGPAQGRGSAWA